MNFITKRYFNKLSINKPKINIYEMFLRDGLQSLQKNFTLEDKFYFYNQISSCGFNNIEVGSTTNPKILPQMKDSFLLWNLIKNDINNNTYNKNLTMLITNENSFKKCIEKGITSFGLLSSTSDIFSKSNLKKSSDETFNDMIYIINSIPKKDLEKYHFRLYLSCSFGTHKEKCDINYLNKLFYQVSSIYNIIKEYNLNYKNIDIVLCDTYGILDLELMNRVLSKITQIKDIEDYIALHLHTDDDFYDLIDTALKYKIYKFDSSILNIGGCPFSGSKNKGNINTYNLISYLEKNNYETNIDISKLRDNQLNIKKKLDE